VSTTSRIPATIDALVSIFATALPDVQVLDGPPNVNLASDFVTVGWSPYKDTAVDATQQFVSLGTQRREEDFTVACYADSYSGDTGASARRARVFQIVAAVEIALRADATLGGVLTLWAEMGDCILHQEIDDRGLVVGVTFHIHCKTRI
jgi:hypothetical protein